MGGSRIPVVTSHGEGRALFASPEAQAACSASQVSARFVDGTGARTQRFPLNPNGSPHAIAAVHSEDGRVLAIMPHPERTLRRANFSYRPAGDLDYKDANDDESPWMAMFYNARRWVG